MPIIILCLENLVTAQTVFNSHAMLMKLFGNGKRYTATCLQPKNYEPKRKLVIRYIWLQPGFCQCEYLCVASIHSRAQKIAFIGKTTDISEKCMRVQFVLPTSPCAPITRRTPINLEVSTVIIRGHEVLMLSNMVSLWGIILMPFVRDKGSISKLIWLRFRLTFRKISKFTAYTKRFR